jgi:hypothetical protein
LGISNEDGRLPTSPNDTFSLNDEYEDAEKTGRQRAPQAQNAIGKKKTGMEAKRLPIIFIRIAAAKTRCR